MASNLAPFVQYLGHSDIAIKSIVTGEKGAQEDHFQAIRLNRAEDYIALRNGKRQLWVNLQKLKPEIGKYISFNDIESYKNVYIDLDCIKPDGFKDYAATEEERVMALSQLPLLRTWLESHTLKCGLELHTGNGAGMVLPIPETKAEPLFIAKLSTFLKMIHADIPNVDAACFDPPRVIGIPGTINAKLETEGRKNQVREIVGDIPTREEDQALLDLINSMEPDPAALTKWAEAYNGIQAPPKDDKDTFNATGQTPQIIEKINGLPKNADSVIDRLNSILTYHTSLKDLLGGKIDRFGGDRSQAEYSACGSLINAGFTDPEINHIMQNVSKIGKWQEEGDHYRFEQTLRKLREAEAAKEEPAGPTPEQIVGRIKENRDALKDPIILAAMAALKGSDPVEYDILIDDIKGAVRGVRVAIIRARVDKFIAEQKKADNEYIIPPGVLAEANKILDEGMGFEYAYQAWQKRHHGDENLGKGLFLSIGAQSCISSKGVHIHACGPRGSGKSDGAEKASEAMPGSHLLVGGASPKALYYLGEKLPAGSVVYLDDIGWNDQAAQMFKTCTTFYREGATHTVVVDQEIMQFKTAPRIIFWLTTADDQTDEQIRDRLLRIDTTETAKHTKEVIDFIFQQRKSGAAAFDSRELEVCQAIIRLLKQVFIDVVIPFSDSIRFEGDPRGATIFADLVSSFAIWRHRIRARDSSGAVVASYEDYKDAETFFNAIRGHGDTKYTPGELRVLQAIKDLHGEATREMVMAKTGVSKGGLADIFNGRSRDGQAKYGLLHKCPALTEEDESIQKLDDTDTRRTKRRKIYQLPASYDIMAAYGKTVYLDDETTIKRTCSTGSDKFAESSQVKNESGKDEVRKFVVKERKREEDTNEPSLVDVVKPENVSLSPKEPKTGEFTNLLPPDSDLHPRTLCRTDADFVRTKPLDTVCALANLPKPPSSCAKCGQDLTGKGTVEKSGKIYCAVVGCGYPVREAKT